MKESNNQIDFLKILKGITENWVVLFSGFLIGGIIGYFISMILPPVYEASTAFMVTIDYSETGALSDAQEDRAMRDVGLLFLNEEVVGKTISDLENRNIDIDREYFLDHAYTEREGSLWRIRYRSKDAGSMKQILETWSSNTNSVFEESLKHALILESEYELLDSLVACIQQSSSEFELEDICGYENIQQINNEISKISEEIQKAKESSWGLFAYLSITKIEDDLDPAEPVRFNRNILVISTSMIGFVLSIIVSCFITQKRP